MTPEQKEHDVCQALCDCAPTAPPTCIDTCGDLVTVEIPDACLECVQTYSQTCGDLVAQCFDDSDPATACYVVIQQLQQPQP